MSITYHEVDLTGMTTTRVFAAVDGDLPVGAMTVDVKRDTVELVIVDEDYRRQGIASGLLAHAREATGAPVLYTSAERTLQGSAFARKHGLRLRGRYRRLSQREANSVGAGLMAAVYGASVIA